jgi:hypothetical protein
MGGLSDFFMGTPQRFEQVNNLSKQQMPIQNQLMNAAQNKGAGGAFGESADYYRNLLSNESPDIQAFQAPEMRRFNEQIMPDLAAQYGALGAGDSNLTGSSFRNAAMGQATDLSERLASMRAQLRQQAATGLQNIGGQALNPYMQNINVPAQQGFLSQALPMAVSGLATGFGGPIGGAAANWAMNKFNPQTKASP